MLTVLTIIVLIAAFLLIGAVLLQPGKGDMTASLGGISSQFGQVFGMSRANDLLSKTTMVLAAIIFLFAIVANKFFVGNTTAEELKPVTEGASVPAAAPTIPSPPVQQMPADARPDLEQAPPAEELPAGEGDKKNKGK